MLEPLRHRDFRLLWTGQSVSMMGNGIYSVALPFQMIQLGGSPLQLGTGFTIFSIAQLLTVLSQPYQEQAGFQDYAKPPLPAERVLRTFCGT